MDGAHSESTAAALFDRILAARAAECGVAWAIVLQESDRYVGHIFLSQYDASQPFEIGVVIGTQFWGSGFGPEALQALIEFGLGELGQSQIVAMVDVDHFASIRALEKSGMCLRREEYDEQGRYFLYAVERAATWRRH